MVFKYEFNALQQALIFGSLLGDANLSPTENIDAFRLRFIHSAAQKEYLYHKYTILQGIVSTPPQSYKLPPDKRTGKIYSRWWFNTVSTISLRKYWGYFYRKQKDNTFKKVLPSYKVLYENLTPEALAFWYMDDGSLKSKGKSNAMRISCESFNYEEIKLLCNVLNNKYGLTVKPQTKVKANNTFIIYIPVESAIEFKNIIQPYLVNCMKFKVTDGNRGSLAD